MSDSTPGRHSVEYVLNRDRTLDDGGSSPSRKSTTKRSSERPTTRERPVPAHPSPALRETKTFAFVNISDPTQSGDANRRKFVRQYVRPVKKSTLEEDAISVRVKEEPTQSDAVGLASGALPFIVMSHPDQGSTAGTRKFVKQNAQRKFRKEKTKKLVLEDKYPPTLPISPPEEEDELEDIPPWEELVSATDHEEPLVRFAINPHSARTTWFPKGRKADEIKIVPAATSIWNHVDSSGTIFPVKMNAESYRLVEYLHTTSETTKVPPAFIPLWFGLILNDASAFNSLLGLALGQQAKCHKLPTRQKFFQYQTKALRSVSDRLSDPAHHKSSGLLTSVIMFLIHDILNDDYERYAINRAGLHRIIELRGGITTLDDCFEQRVFVLVAEVCGAISFDFAPEYYLPDMLLHIPPQVSPIPLSSRLRWLVRTWLQNFPTRTEVVRNFNDLHAVNAEVILDCPNIWRRPASLVPEVHMVIIRFVYLANHLDPAQQGYQVERSLIGASLIHLNILRDALGDYFTRLDHNIVERLRASVIPDTQDWEGLEPMRLWCLVMGGIVSEGGEREEFVGKTTEVMRQLRCGDWDDAIGIVVELAYVEQLFGQKCREFGKDVMAGWMESA